MQVEMLYGGDRGPPGPLSPQELAAQLAANVWPELYDGLLSMVLAGLKAASEEETQAYWRRCTHP